jgi:hypothetical protein
VQTIGASSPDTVASAPAGVEATLIVSVVPRVTDAQPPTMAHSAKHNKTRMKLKSPSQTLRPSSATRKRVQGDEQIFVRESMRKAD